MTDKDIAIGITGLPQIGALSKKPPHLILLEDEKKKSAAPKKFITTDKPDIGAMGFVQAKGIFSEASEETIVASYADLLNSAHKEEFVEMMFPHHKVVSIRNLVFKAK